MRIGRSVLRFKDRGMEVPGAEGRGAVVPGTERGLNRGRQSAEQSGFPKMIKWVGT